MSQPTPEFLPCPFCGSRIVGLAMLGETDEFDPADKSVQCGVCGARGPSLVDTHAEGTVKWNERAEASKSRAKRVHA